MEKQPSEKLTLEDVQKLARQFGIRHVIVEEPYKGTTPQKCTYFACNERMRPGMMTIALYKKESSSKCSSRLCSPDCACKYIELGANRHHK